VLCLRLLTFVMVLFSMNDPLSQSAKLVCQNG
jgi:hypothetical protein